MKRAAWLAPLLLMGGAAMLRAEAGRAPSAEPPALDRTTPAPTSSAQAPAVADAGAHALPDMLLVPAGTFTMGADNVGERDEQPAHPVTLAAFWLDTTEVTNGAYLECVAAKACAMYKEDVARRFGAGPDSAFRAPNQPVIGVSWYDATNYCKFRGKRLPSEAEWERAARGDDGRRYAWGNQAPDARHACFGRAVGAAGATTMPVASYPEGRGPYGHFDLTGNVWEWTADVYDPYAYRRDSRDRGVPGSCEQALGALRELRETHQQGFTGSNPIPTTCERVLRGGAFNYPGPWLRASNRVHHPPEFRIAVAGFRCAKSD